jgi:Domain of unknown function (DUF4760)
MLQFVTVAITLVAIYRQVRLQASAAEIEHAEALEREWNSERLIRARLAVLMELRDGTDPLMTARAAAADIGNFWERFGYLVRGGHLDQRLVYEYQGNSIANFWAHLRPTVKSMREQSGDPKIYDHFEWLAGRIEEMEGRPAPMLAYDSEERARSLTSGIDFCLQGIRAAEELRAVIVRPMSATTLTPEPPLA